MGGISLLTEKKVKCNMAEEGPEVNKNKMFNFLFKKKYFKRQTPQSNSESIKVTKNVMEF